MPVAAARTAGRSLYSPSKYSTLKDVKEQYVAVVPETGTALLRTGADPVLHVVLAGTAWRFPGSCSGLNGTLVESL